MLSRFHADIQVLLVNVVNFFKSFNYYQNILPSAMVETSIKSFTISFMFDDDNQEPLETLAPSTAEFQLMANDVIRQVRGFIVFKVVRANVIQGKLILKQKQALLRT